MTPSYSRPVVQTLPLREQPGARVRADSTACTTLELLAALIGGPQQIEIAQRLLTHFGSLSNVFAAPPTALIEISGIGPLTVARLRAALELGLRAATQPPEQRPQIRSVADAAELLIPQMCRLEQEQFKLILLDTRMYVIDVVTLYVGSVNQQVIRVAEVFREAIRRNATALVLAHNHPSGDVSPSPEDVSTTRAIINAGHLLDVEIVDHLIISGRGQHAYVSLKERGLGFDD
jgi:DNA repair protein RadC